VTWLFAARAAAELKRQRAEAELQGALQQVQTLQKKLEAENVYLQEEISKEHNFEEIVGGESMQSCGVITLRPRPGIDPRLAENPGATAGMHFPRCRSARESGRRGNSGRCAGSIASVASSPFAWRQSR
jgi:hypothetical protein